MGQRSCIPAAIVRSTMATLLGAAWLLVAGLSCAGMAAAQTTGKNPSHEDILRGFDAAAFWASREDVRYGGAYNPVGFVIKWTGPIIYRIDGMNYDKTAIDRAIAILRRQATIAGLEVREAKSIADANFSFIFHNVSAFSLNGRKANCYAQPKFDGLTGVMKSVKLNINLAYASSVDQCIIHEALHGFGLMNHPHKLHSVLSYFTQAFVHDLTEADIVMLQTLYDPRLSPGTLRLEGLQKADAIIEEKRRAMNPDAMAKTDAAHVFAEVAADLEKNANAGNQAAIIHISQAYRLGIGVAKDDEKADAWLTKIASHEDVNRRFRLAHALETGAYGIRDRIGAARMFRLNAELGHARSQNYLGMMLRDGVEIPENKIEALFWFTLAAQDGLGLAEVNRDTLAEMLPQDHLDAAFLRVQAWISSAQAAK